MIPGAPPFSDAPTNVWLQQHCLPRAQWRGVSWSQCQQPRRPPARPHHTRHPGARHSPHEHSGNFSRRYTILISLLTLLCWKFKNHQKQRSLPISIDDCRRLVASTFLTGQLQKIIAFKFNELMTLPERVEGGHDCLLPGRGHDLKRHCDDASATNRMLWHTFIPYRTAKVQCYTKSWE